MHTHTHVLSQQLPVAPSDGQRVGTSPYHTESLCLQTECNCHMNSAVLP